MRFIIRWPRPARPFHLDRTPGWVDRLHCALTGHDDEIVLGQRVIALGCRRCNWRSAGWRLDRGAAGLLPSRRTSLPKLRLPLGWRARTTT